VSWMIWMMRGWLAILSLLNKGGGGYWSILSNVFSKNRGWGSVVTAPQSTTRTNSNLPAAFPDIFQKYFRPRFPQSIPENQNQNRNKKTNGPSLAGMRTALRARWLRESRHFFCRGQITTHKKYATVSHIYAD